MNEYLKSQIEEHCQMVQRGAKPLSLLPYQERYHDEIVDIINNHKLHYSSELNSEGWRTIYIYKNKTLRYLIAELPMKPETASEHALIGYLLGYSTDSICEYILQNCQLEEQSAVTRTYTKGQKVKVLVGCVWQKAEVEDYHSEPKHYLCGTKRWSTHFHESSIKAV